MFLFFLFMLFCTLLLPATMLFFGRRWQKSPPKEINGAYGYRTRRSMSGLAAWDFAHRWIGLRFSVPDGLPLRSRSSEWQCWPYFPPTLPAWRDLVRF